jgi:hypothetical protein
MKMTSIASAASEMDVTSMAGVVSTTMDVAFMMKAASTKDADSAAERASTVNTAPVDADTGEIPPYVRFGTAGRTVCRLFRFWLEQAEWTGPARIRGNLYERIAGHPVILGLEENSEMLHHNDRGK